MCWEGLRLGMGMGMSLGMGLGMGMGPPGRQRAIKIKVIDSIWKCLTHDAGCGAAEGFGLCVRV